MRRFVIRTTLVCAALALFFDVINQSVFAVDWPSAARSWLITAGVVLVIAVPVARAVGRAHLDLYRAKLAVEELSRTDPLTGLLNRRAVFDLAATSPAVMALVIVDIDRFKRINDAFGHLVGDEVIRTVGHTIERFFGACARVGRIGGEEFAIVCFEHDLSRLVELLHRFKDEIAATAIISGSTSVSVTISAGVAGRQPGQTFADLYGAADRALYVAKAAGRNQVVLADEVAEMDPAATTSRPAPQRARA